MKKCAMCQKILEFSKFVKSKSRSNGLSCYCLICTRIRNKIDYNKRKYKILAKCKIYRDKQKIINPQKKIEYSKQWRIKNKEKIRIKRTKYNSLPETIQKRRKNKRQYYHTIIKNKPQEKTTENLRRRLRFFIKTGRGHMLNLIGCSKEFLVNYIENQWAEGMNWNNYGKKIGNWSIDHKIPCKSFDFKNIEEQKKCFHYSNLQPMWVSDNCRKGAKLLPELQSNKDFKLLM